MMVYGVIGPRDFNNVEYTNYSLVNSALKSAMPGVIRIVSGGSKGIERLVERFAKENNIEIDVVKPEIGLHGPQFAFSVRNREIIDSVQKLIVFWDGKNSNIVEALSQAMLARKEVVLIPMQ